MTPSLTSRRQADEFARAVDQPRAGSDAAPRWEPLREVVTALRSTPDVSPRDEFVTQLRESLMTEADRVLAPAEPSADPAASLRLTPRTPARRRRDRRLASAAVGCVLAGTTASMALAAQSALPGEPLYTVKQGIETLQRATTFSEVARGQELLEDATNRLQEIARLSHQDTPEAAAAISETLEDFVALAREGAALLIADYRENGTESSIVRVRSFVADSLETLALLHEMVPAGVQESLRDAAQALQEIDAEALAACPTCGSMPAAQVPAVLVGATSAAEAPVVDPGHLETSPGQDGASSTGGAAPELPDVKLPDLPDVEDLPPASVTEPDAPAPDPGGSPDSGSQDPTPTRDTLNRLTDSLLTGGSETVENVVDTGTDVVDTGTDTLNGLTGPLLGISLDAGSGSAQTAGSSGQQTSGPQDDSPGDNGGLVDGLVDGLEQGLGGLTGGGGAQ